MVAQHEDIKEATKRRRAEAEAAFDRDPTSATDEQVDFLATEAEANTSEEDLKQNHARSKTVRSYKALAEKIRRRGWSIEEGASDNWRSRLTPIGSITLAEAQDLLLDILHPTGHTIIFGQGDTGKGTIASWLANDLRTELNLRTLIVDFEHNEGEWQPRLMSLGYTPDDSIQYFDPDDRPIWDQAADIKAAAEAMNADYVIIDSITFACMSDVSGGDTSFVARYRQALETIGLPVLSLAHVPKSGQEHKFPFGSIFWHNAARVTWRIDHLEVANEGGEIPSRKVILTCCKRNDGLKPAKKIIEIIYAPGRVGLPIEIEVHTYSETQAERFASILKIAAKPLSSTEIAKAYNAALDPEDENAKQLDAVAVGKVMRRKARNTKREQATFSWDSGSEKWSLAAPQRGKLPLNLPLDPSEDDQK